MRCDSIIRCFQTIDAMKQKGGVTASSLAVLMGVSRRTAYRYIESASLVLPVYQHEGYPTKFELNESAGSVRQGRDDNYHPLRGRLLGQALKVGFGSGEFNR